MAIILKNNFVCFYQDFMRNVLMNDNCQEYDCSMEALLLCSDKVSHLCSKDTHITFLLIYMNNRQVNMNRTFQIIGKTGQDA